MKARRTIEPGQEPGPPAQLTVDAGVLSELATQVGIVIGQNQQITQRMAGVESGVQEVRKDVGNLRAENAAQHAETAQQISALGGEFSDVKRRVGVLEEKQTTPSPPQGSSEGRKGGGFEGWGKTMDALKTYTPWLYGLGVLITGAVITWLNKKGSAAAP